MARPIKWRKIENVPKIVYFVPSHEGAKATPESRLKLEELEAIRLKDLEGLEQYECADRMRVSRPTFQRILLSAREKIADSLVNGKTIHIGGGNYTRNICSVTCVDCGAEWMERFENLNAIEAGSYICPECGSNNVACGHSCQGRFGRKNCWRHGRFNR